MLVRNVASLSILLIGIKLGWLVAVVEAMMILAHGVG
jgi:hypothetical protein